MASSPFATFSKAKRRRKKSSNNKISQHNLDMACMDNSRTNHNSNTSLNLNDSNKDSWLTRNEIDYQQSDSPQNDSHISQVIPWWEDNHQEKCENEDDSSDDMLTTSDEKLQKIVNGALNIMLTSSKTTIRNQIKTFADRKVLTGHLHKIRSENASTHSKRYARLPRETHYSDHPSTFNGIITPIDPTNIGHQLLKKIGWTPGNGLGLNQNGIKTPIETTFRHHRQGLGYEKTPFNTNESFFSRSSQIQL